MAWLSEDGFHSYRFIIVGNFGQIFAFQLSLWNKVLGLVFFFNLLKLLVFQQADINADKYAYVFHTDLGITKEQVVWFSHSI